MFLRSVYFKVVAFHFKVSSYRHDMTEFLEHIVNHTEELACDKHAKYVSQALCDKGRARWPVKVINKLLLLDTSNFYDYLRKPVRNICCAGSVEVFARQLRWRH